MNKRQNSVKMFSTTYMLEVLLRHKYKLISIDSQLKYYWKLYFSNKSKNNNPEYDVSPFFFTENPNRAKRGNKEMPSTAVSLITSVNAETLHTYVRSGAINSHQIRSVLRHLAELISTLHSVGLYHGDLSVRHVLVTQHEQVS